MEKVQLNFTERAARSFNTEATLLSATTELYDLYSRAEDIQLFIEIVGDDKRDIPSIYIDGMTLKTLRHTLLQLTRTALDNCIVWLRDYDGKVLQEFAVACHKRYEDFAVYDRSFRLCPFAECSPDYSSLNSDTIICCEEEITEIYNNIKNIINNH